MDLKEFQEFKERIHKAQRQADKLVGTFDHLLKKVKELGCASIKDLERLIARLHKEHQEFMQEAAQLRAEWEERWKGKL